MTWSQRHEAAIEAAAAALLADQGNAVLPLHHQARVAVEAYLRAMASPGSTGARYLLFAYDNHDARGGWEDVLSEHESLEDAKTAADAVTEELADVVELLDGQPGRVVAQGFHPPRPMVLGEYTQDRPPWVWTAPDEDPASVWRNSEEAQRIERDFWERLAIAKREGRYHGELP